MYSELLKRFIDVELPTMCLNGNNEEVIVHKWHNDNGNYFCLVTAQNNGRIRHNYYYEDGTEEEIYEEDEENKLQ